MYVVTNRVPVTENYKTEFENRFKDRAGKINQLAGFIRMEVMRPVDESSPYLVMTVWENEAAFSAWIGSEDFKLAHQNPLPKEAYATEGGGMEKHEIFISASSKQS